MSQKDQFPVSDDPLSHDMQSSEMLFTSLLKKFEATYATQTQKSKSEADQQKDQDSVKKTVKSPVKDTIKNTTESALALIGLRLDLKAQRLLELAQLYPSCLRELKLYFQKHNLRQQALESDWQKDLVPQALVQYLNYIARQPNDHQIRLYCGRILIQRGEVDAALALYKKGAAYGEDAYLLALKAEISLSQAQFNDAYETALKARRLSQDSSEMSGLVDIELIYFRSAQYLGKEDLIHFPLMQLSLQNPDHILLKARALSQPNPYCTPSEQLAAVYEAYQQQPHRYLRQAYIHALIRNQDYLQAYQEAKSLLKQVTLDTEALLSLVLSAFHLSKIDEAIKHCETLREKLPHSQDILAVYLILLSQNGASFESLKPMFEGLYAHATYSPRIALYCIELLSLWEQYTPAQALTQNLQQDYPYLFRVQMNYVEMLLRLGNLEEAKEYLSILWHNQAFEAILDDGQSVYPQRMHLLSAEIALLSNLEESDYEKEFHTALEKCADQPSKLEFEVRYYIKQQEFEQAKAKAYELCQQKPMNPAYLEYLLNMIWQTEADIVPKLIEFEQNLHPVARQASLLTLLAYLLLKKGEAERSKSLCDEALSDEALKQNQVMSFGVQRFMMACETAYVLKHKVALKLWSEQASKHFADHPQIQFYLAMSHWYEGQFSEALYLSLGSLEQSLEQEGCLQDPQFAEQLLITTIWACELEDYQQAKVLLELLYEHEASDEHELEALLLRVYLNQDDEVTFNQGVQLAQTWVQDSDLAEHKQKVELLVDWLLEAIPIKSLDSLGEDEGLFDDQMLPSPLNHERLTIALSLLNQYLTTESQDLSLWRRLAMTHVQLEDLDSALFCLEHICTFPDCIAYDYFILSKVFESMGQIDQARSSLERGLSIVEPDERFNYLQNLACVLIKQGDHQYARHIFESLISQVYELAQAELSELDLKADHQDILKDQDSKGAYLVEEWKVESLETSVSELLHLWLAQSLNECELSESQVLVEELSERFSARIIDAFKGLILSAYGQSAQALPLLEEAHHELDILSGDYAQCLWSLGQHEKAINILYQCISSQPTFSEYHISLIKWLLEEKRPQEAHPLFLDFITLHPEHEEIEDLEHLLHTQLVYH